MTFESFWFVELFKALKSPLLRGWRSLPSRTMHNLPGPTSAESSAILAGYSPTNFLPSIIDLAKF